MSTPSMIPTAPDLDGSVETALTKLGFKKHIGLDPSAPSVYTATSAFGPVGKTGNVSIYTRCTRDPHTTQGGDSTWRITHTLGDESGVMRPPSLSKSIVISERDPDVEGTVMQEMMGHEAWEEAMESNAARDLFGRGNAIANAMSKADAKKALPKSPEELTKVVSAQLQKDTGLQSLFDKMGKEISRDVGIQWDPLPLPGKASEDDGADDEILVEYRMQINLREGVDEIEQWRKRKV